MQLRRELFLWVGTLAFLAVIGWAFYLVFSPFFEAIAWAVILAILLAPVQRWLGKWVEAKGWRALITVLLAAILFLGPVLAIGTALVNEAVLGLRYLQANAAEIGRQVETWSPGEWGPLRAATEWFEAHLAGHLGFVEGEGMLESPDLQRTITEGAQRLSQWLLNQTSAAFRNLAELLLTFIITWLTLFYLLRDGDRVLHAVIELLPYPPGRRDAMLSHLNEVVISSVYGGLAVAVVQGLLGGLAFAILGLPSPVLWGVVMAFLAFLPLVGAFIVWAPAAAILAVQGAYGKAIFLAAWGLVAVGLIDNVLRPYLISGRTRMHPLAVFLAVLGGIHAFGFLGLFLGPVLVAVVTGTIDLYREVVSGEVVVADAGDGDEGLPGPADGERQAAGGASDASRREEAEAAGVDADRPDEADVDR